MSHFLVIGKNSTSTIGLQFNDADGVAEDLSSNTVKVQVDELSIDVTASANTDGSDGAFTATIPSQSGVVENQLYDGSVLVSGNTPIEVGCIGEGDGDSGSTPNSYVVVGSTTNIQAAVGGGASASALNDLSDVSTAGATDGQALVYSSSGSAWGPGTVSGGSSTQWGQQATSSTWHLWEDFIGSEGGTVGGVWWSGDVNSSGSVLNKANADAAEVFGNMEIGSTSGTESWGVLTTGTLSKASPSDLETAIFEANIKPDIDVSGSGEVCIVVGGLCVNQNYEDDVYGFLEYGGATTPDRVVLGWLAGQDNFRYASGSGQNLSLSTSDSGVTAANSYVRLAIKCVFSATGNNWIWQAFIDGSSVGIGTLSNANQLSAQVLTRASGTSSSGKKSSYVDWMHAQLERGSITYVT